MCRDSDDNADNADGADPADGADTAESTESTESSESTESTEDGSDAAADGEENADALPRTGIKTNLAVVALLLIAAGVFAVSTGRHLWLKAQLTNAFRVVPLNSTFTVEHQRRSRRRGRRGQR